MAAPSYAAHIHPAEEPASAVRLRRPRLLVVDDEVAICRSLQRLLSKEHDVTIECDARRGAVLAATGDFDVVFCDLMMPGMTGMDLYEAVASSRPDVARRIVFMTAGSFSPRSWDFLESTENKHLTKPFDPAALSNAVVELLEREGPHDAHDPRESGTEEVQRERA
jgi:DNA-binding response OmpR family regulator